MVMRFVPAAGASAVVLLVLITLDLDSIPRGIALGLVALAWLMPLLFARRAVGAHGSMVAGVAAVATAGQLRTGVPYGVACALFLVVGVAALRRVRAAAPIPRPRLRTVVPMLAVGGAVSAGLVLGLPPLSARVERRMNDMFGRFSDEETAFSTRMRLGATRGMLQRSTVVMRIAGPAPEYLRGAVYDRYEGATWITTKRGRDTTLVDSVPGDRPSRIVLARGTAEDSDMRWFLPAGACDLVTVNDAIEVDAFGIARRPNGDSSGTIAYRTSGCVPPPIAGPGPNDSDNFTWLQPRLKAIGDAWTTGAATPREKLDAIVRHLARFEYSLEVPRDERVDPILDFLTLNRAGHCEFFASAFVLLARVQGIPARVIGGYRVSEVNPLTGLAIVRERNAHAWAEAWVDGAWRAWDPTPGSDGPRSRASMLENVGDLVAMKWSALVTLLARLGPLGIVAIGVAGIVLWFLVRVVLERVRHALRTRARPSAERPLPCFERLTAALEHAGLHREDAEPLEIFAGRLAACTEEWAADAAIAVTMYAALRYGGIGDGAMVAQQLDRVARAIH